LKFNRAPLQTGSEDVSHRAGVFLHLLASSQVTG
jgi:hypothetical protein